MHVPWPPERDDDPDLCTLFLLSLGQHFPEVQFFLTDRRIMFHAWARVIDGALVRQYAHYATTVWYLGESTPAELAIGHGFPDLRIFDWATVEDDQGEVLEGLKNEELDGLIPGEDDVMSIAGGWSINPQTLEDLGLPPGLGYQGRLPEL